MFKRLKNIRTQTSMLQLTQKQKLRLKLVISLVNQGLSSTRQVCCRRKQPNMARLRLSRSKLRLSIWHQTDPISLNAESTPLDPFKSISSSRAQEICVKQSRRWRKSKRRRQWRARKASLRLETVAWRPKSKVLAASNWRRQITRYMAAVKHFLCRHLTLLGSLIHTQSEEIRDERRLFIFYYLWNSNNKFISN